MTGIHDYSSMEDMELEAFEDDEEEIARRLYRHNLRERQNAIPAWRLDYFDEDKYEDGLNET